jgi:hypothetical protein
MSSRYFLGQFLKKRDQHVDLNPVFDAMKNLLGLKMVADVKEQVAICANDPWTQKVVLDTAAGVDHQKPSADTRRPKELGGKPGDVE